MSTAVLTVYIDSASDLPQARSQSKPNPYVILSVGKTNEQTNALTRTDVPVWEQGFTFLVANPENDTLHLRIVDQKTEKDLGQLTYILSLLLTQTNMELVSQPFQLQKSGPESKIIMSMALKILKNAPEQVELEDEAIADLSSNGNVTAGSELSRTNSVRKQSETSQKSGQMKLSDVQGLEITDNSDSGIQESFISVDSHKTLASPGSSSTNDNNDISSHLIHRTLSTTLSAGSAGLGRIQITLRYSIQRQRLVVIVHKIMQVFKLK